MKKITDTMTTPPGGWFYVEPTTGVEFRNLNYNAMVINIRAHKEACGLPLGPEWLDEMQQVMIALNPLIRCEEEGVKTRSFNGTDIVRFVETMNQLRGQQMVSEEEQLRRADICAACPKKGVITCRGCNWLAGQITQIMGGRKLPRIEKIYKQSCMACGCDITAKTACPTDVLKKVDEKLGLTPDYDEGCWMRE